MWESDSHLLSSFNLSKSTIWKCPNWGRRSLTPWTSRAVLPWRLEWCRKISMHYILPRKASLGPKFHFPALPVKKNHGYRRCLFKYHKILSPMVHIALVKEWTGLCVWNQCILSANMTISLWRRSGGHILARRWSTYPSMLGRMMFWQWSPIWEECFHLIRNRYTKAIELRKPRFLKEWITHFENR